MNQIHQSEILNFEARLNDYHQTAEKYRIELEKLTNVLSTKHDEVKLLKKFFFSSYLNFSND